MNDLAQGCFGHGLSGEGEGVDFSRVMHDAQPHVQSTGRQVHKLSPLRDLFSGPGALNA